jgi:O-antigen/teichoic acid export membrane protein
MSISPEHSLPARQPIARESTLSLIDQLVASATNFATGVIIGRVGTQEEFGLYLLGFTVVSLGLLLQTSLISSPYMVYRPRLDEVEGAEYSGSVLLQQVGLSFCVIAGLVVFGSIVEFGWGPEGFSRVIWVLSVAAAFILFREFVRRICFATLEFTDAVRLDVVTAVIQVGGLLLLAWRWPVTAWASYIVIGIASATAAIGWLMTRRGWFVVSLQRFLHDFRSNWNLGKWLAGSALLWESNVVLYPWLLTFFHGAASAGVWAACFGVVALANPLMLGMQNSLGPQMAHAFASGGMPRLKRTMFRGAALFTLLVVPVVAIVILFGSELIEFIYGPKYVGYGTVVVPLALELMVAPARFVISRALVVTGNSRLDFLTNIVSLLVMLIFGIFLVREFGPLGVAVGMFIGSVMVTTTKYISTMVIFRRNRESPMS